MAGSRPKPSGFRKETRIRLETSPVRKRIWAVGSDRDLIRRCRQGNRGVWHQVLNKYERLVYSISLKYGLSRDDADIAQITFTILIQSLNNLSEDSRPGP